MADSQNNSQAQANNKEPDDRPRLRERLGSIQHTAFERFPLVFTLLGTFGLVATLYGFEGVLDGIDVFAENPLLMLIFGVLLLVGTGSLYRQLNSRE
jgi:hypothetical protein